MSFSNWHSPASGLVQGELPVQNAPACSWAFSSHWHNTNEKHWKAEGKQTLSVYTTMIELILLLHDCIYKLFVEFVLPCLFCVVPFCIVASRCCDDQQQREGKVGECQWIGDLPWLHHYCNWLCSSLTACVNYIHVNVLPKTISGMTRTAMIKDTTRV